MHGIYANKTGVYSWSMLPYIAYILILWDRYLTWKSGWWFGCHLLFSHTLEIIITIDFHIFQRVAQPPTSRVIDTSHRALTCRVPEAPWPAPWSPRTSTTWPRARRSSCPCRRTANRPRGSSTGPEAVMARNTSYKYWTNSIWDHLGVSWNGGTPSHHPFLDGIL